MNDKYDKEQLNDKYDKYQMNDKYGKYETNDKYDKELLKDKYGKRQSHNSEHVCLTALLSVNLTTALLTWFCTYENLARTIHAATCLCLKRGYSYPSCTLRAQHRLVMKQSNLIHQELINIYIPLTPS